MELTETFEAESSVDISSLPNLRVHGQNEFDSELEGAKETESSEQTGIPEKIKSFLIYFQKHIHQKNVDEITSLYDSTFRKLTERYHQTKKIKKRISINNLHVLLSVTTAHSYGLLVKLLLLSCLTVRNIINTRQLFTRELYPNR